MGDSSSKPWIADKKCEECGKDLPPCQKSSDSKFETPIKRGDNTYYVLNILEGRYYAYINTTFFSVYYCPECFLNPKEDHVSSEIEDQSLLPEQQAHELEQVQIKVRVHKREEELARRQEEAMEESLRQEAMCEEEEKRMEERRQLKEMNGKRQAQNDHRFFVKNDLSQRFLAWKKEVKVHKAVHFSNPFKHPKPSVHRSADSYNEDDSDIFLSGDEEVTQVSSEMVNTVATMISDLQPDQELDGEWLRAVQTFLLTNYSQKNALSHLEIDILMDFLAYVQSGLNNKESLYLAKTLCSIGDIHPSDYCFNEDISLPCKFSSLLLHHGHLHHENSQWMHKCLRFSVSAMIEDKQLQKMIAEAVCESWSAYDWFCLIQKCDILKFSAFTQKHFLHQIQTYSIKPNIADEALRSTNTIDFLDYHIKNEPDKLLTDIMNEIGDTRLVDTSILNQVEEVVTAIHKLLEERNFHIDLDYNTHLGSPSNVSAAVEALKQMPVKDEALNFYVLADAIITLMCAVQKAKGFHLYDTQLVAFIILLFSSQHSVNRLLQILPGEGKSTVIAMFATVLGIQGRQIDIVTSSPILALRDAEEWGEFYRIFGLTATHNTNLRHSSHVTDEEKQVCYSNPIVYGTVSSFSADILHENFERKQVRGGRQFDTVIVDEVDLLTLDEGVKFTYLSHDAAVLHHIKPVLTAVWAVVGPFRPVTIASRGTLYSGIPKLFTDAIFECLDPATSGVECSSQLLTIARNFNLISDDQLQKLTDADPEAKKAAMSMIKPESALALVAELENYIPCLPDFEFYITNDEGRLVMVDSQQEESEGVKFLFLENGMACTLNTQEELWEGAAKKVQENLQFTDEDSKTKVKLPHFLKEFVMNQVPTYVKSATRALQMVENREYAIGEKGNIIPVDFENSGVMEMNKCWSGGLQQMLEIKHNLCLSSVSLVTNFMSQIEFFSSYHGIYGLSGTLGLDSKVTPKVLNQLYGVQVCSIPTRRPRKCYEKPAIIVEGEDKWFEQIANVVEEAVKEEVEDEKSWKKGRAVLVLCEDIKTAEDLRKYMLTTEKYGEDKVHLYARSNSRELDIVKETLGPGEILIATNLAGRGTDIKVREEVNESGGLLCLLTFLPRNRRVELQAFGRTGRAGQPGSMQCILETLSLPHNYQGLDLEVIRRLKEDEEAHRLDHLLKFDVKEVKLKEKLFKKYCEFLKMVHSQFCARDSVSIMVKSLNENWGQWLQMRAEQIEQLEEEKLISDLSQSLDKWQPSIPFSPAENVTYQLLSSNPQFQKIWQLARQYDPNNFIHLPVTNFYHLVEFGNQLLIKNEKENAHKAITYFTESIEMEPAYALIPYYNRAYCSIVTAKSGYQDRAMEDLKSARKCLDPYIQEAMSNLHCVSAVNHVKGTLGEHHEAERGDFTSQMQARLQILGFIRKNIEEAIKKLEELSRSDVIAKPVGIFSLIPNANYATNKELALMWTLGMEMVFSVEKKPSFSWSSLFCFFLGVVQIAAGALLTVCSVGTAASIGMGLIGEGISDCISGIEGMAKGEFSWTEWAISKATSLTISLVSGGIGRLAADGTKALKAGYKVAKQLKTIPVNSFGEVATTNLKKAMKYVGEEVATEVREWKAITTIAKDSFEAAGKKNLKNVAYHVAQQGVIEGVSYAQNMLLDHIIEETVALISKKCKENLVKKLQTEFADGKLRKIVDQKFLSTLDESYRSRDEIPPLVCDEAQDFFSTIADVVIHSLVSDSEVEQRLLSASMSLLAQVSQNSKKDGKLALFTNMLEISLMESIVVETLDKLATLLDQFVPETERVCLDYMKNEGITVSDQAATEHVDLKSAIKLRTDLADYVGDTFGNAVANLLQQNIGPVVNHGMNRTIGHMSTKVLGKFVYSDKTQEKIQAAQHANYIRSVEANPSSHNGTTNSMTANYAKRVAHADNPGSLMDLRIAVEDHGRGVAIYQEKNGKFVRDCSIHSSSKSKDDEIKLIYTPPSDHQSVGHYDVLVDGKRIKVEADNSNCLFHAYACGLNPNLAHGELKQHAEKVRQRVAKCIEEEPQKWAEHIKRRVEMDRMRKGNRFAMIGAGEKNHESKILEGFYESKAIGKELLIMYEQGNGIKCRSVYTYNDEVTLDEHKTVINNSRLAEVEVHMDGLSISKNEGKRCWDTEPVTGQIKRPGGQSKDSEVSFHLCPSRGGACAGNAYGNAVMASPQQNNLETEIWCPAVKKCIGKGEFSMTVTGKAGPIVPDNPTDEHRIKFFQDMNERKSGQRITDEETQKKVWERLKLVKENHPLAYRMEELTLEIHFPKTATHEQLKNIRSEISGKNNGLQVVDVNDDKKTVTITMPKDHDMFIPENVSSCELMDNGELRSSKGEGEITNAVLKKPNLTAREPNYTEKKTLPDNSITEQRKVDLRKRWDALVLKHSEQPEGTSVARSIARRAFAAARNFHRSVRRIGRGPEQRHRGEPLLGTVPRSEPAHSIARRAFATARNFYRRTIGHGPEQRHRGERTGSRRRGRGAARSISRRAFAAARNFYRRVRRTIGRGPEQRHRGETPLLDIGGTSDVTMESASSHGESTGDAIMD